MTAETDAAWTAEELRERIAAGWEPLNALVRGLPDDSLLRADETGWSVRDYLAHLTAWERSLLGLLQGRSRLEAMGLATGSQRWDTDDINARVLELGRRQQPTEVVLAFTETHRLLMSTLAQLTREDLLRPYSSYRPGAFPGTGEPVIGWVLGNTMGHYAEHLPAIARLAGAG